MIHAQRVRRTAEPDWKPIQRGAERFHRKMRRAISDSVLVGRRALDYGALTGSLMNRNTDPTGIDRETSFLTALMEHELKPQIVALSQQTLAQSEALAFRSLQRSRNAARTPLTGRFDLTNPAALQWVREHAAELIADISTKTRDAIRQILVRSFERGVNAQKTAQAIRLVIGLSDKQEISLDRLREKLEVASDSLIKVGNQAIRVPEAGLSEARISQLLNRYADFLLRQRADAIARTEIIAAANEGQKQAWLRAEQKGLLDRAVVDRVWIVTPDDRLCPICESMSGERAALDGTFTDSEGNHFDGPPAHPRCRCAQGLAPAGMRTASAIAIDDRTEPRNSACAAYFDDYVRWAIETDPDLDEDMRIAVFDKKAYMKQYHIDHYEKKKKEKAEFIGPLPQKVKKIKPVGGGGGEAGVPAHPAGGPPAPMNPYKSVKPDAPMPPGPPVPAGISPKIQESQPTIVVTEVVALKQAMMQEAAKKAGAQLGVGELKQAPVHARGAVKAAINKDLSQRLRAANPELADRVFREGQKFKNVGEYTRDTIDNWAQTSGDHSKTAIQRQDVIREEFGLSAETMTHLPSNDPLSGDFREVAKVYVRAEYEATQAWFKSQGITHVSLYRGVRSTKGLVGGNVDEAQDVMMQPASSWSTSKSTARGFAGGKYLLEVRVPVERILSTSVTGRGCLNESEVLVIGGATRVRVTGLKKH